MLVTQTPIGDINIPDPPTSDPTEIKLAEAAARTFIQSLVESNLVLPEGESEDPRSHTQTYTHKITVKDGVRTLEKLNPQIPPPVPEELSTTELLNQHAILMNEHGADSIQERSYCDQHSNNKDFTSKADTARTLKKALQYKAQQT